MNRRQRWRDKLTQKQLNLICHLGLLREIAHAQTRGDGPLSIDGIAKAGGVKYSTANNAVYAPEIYGNNDFYRSCKTLIDYRMAIRCDLEKIKLSEIAASFDLNSSSIRKLLARQLDIYKNEVPEKKKTK